MLQKSWVSVKLSYWQLTAVSLLAYLIVIGTKFTKLFLNFALIWPSLETLPVIDQTGLYKKAVARGPQWL